MFTPIGINNFTVIESVYGRFIVNRHNMFQIESLAKTGRTHIEQDLNIIYQMIDTLPDNAIILDGGANIGFFTIPVAQRIKHRGSKVLSFEPQKMMFYALSGTVALNDLRNVYPVNAALGDESGFVSLPELTYHGNFHPNCDFGQIQVSKEFISDENHVLSNCKIQCVTIDSLNLDRLDFLKLDVEGFEIQALLGAANTIKKCRPYIWIEYWIAGADNIVDCFKDIGDYDFFKMTELDMVCVPKEKLELVMRPV